MVMSVGVLQVRIHRMTCDAARVCNGEWIRYGPSLWKLEKQYEYENTSRDGNKSRSAEAGVNVFGQHLSQDGILAARSVELQTHTAP